MIKNIVVSGQLQNGKTTVSKYFISKFPSWSMASIAFTVKKIFCETFEVDMAFIEKWKVSSEIPPGFDMPCRQAMQFIGEGFRKIKRDIWVSLAFRSNPEKKIFEDGRYLNEMSVNLKNSGFNILICNPQKINDDPDESEAQLRPLIEWFLNTGLEGEVIKTLMEQNACCGSTHVIPQEALLVDFFIRNDGTLEDLYKKIDEQLIPLVQKKGLIV